MRSLRAPIDRPNLLWRAFVIGGVTTMTVLSFSDDAWGWWEEHVTTAIPRDTIRGVLRTTVMVHISEARYARRRARAAGLEDANAWARTTLLYGFPELGLLRRRIREQQAIETIEAGLHELIEAA
jgi:hypothetical protein